MQRLILLAMALFLVSGTRADYVMPPFRAVVEEATSIVDATVVELQERGRVRIAVHRVLSGGTPQDVLSSAHYTCFGVDLSRRLRLGQRYVLLLHDASLYEENTFYEVREGKDNLECNCWDGSEEFQRRWMAISEFERLLAEAQQD